MIGGGGGGGGGGRRGITVRQIALKKIMCTE